MNHSFTKATVLATALFSTGCAVNETMFADLTALADTEHRIESNSGLLASKLTLEEAWTEHKGDLLHVQALIKNDSSDQLSFQYQFKWFDQNGFELATDGRPWTPMTIAPHQLRSVQALAPNANATKFSLQVRD